MKPITLPFNLAVEVATTVEKTVHAAGFIEAEVAIVEGTAHCSVAHGPKLLSFNALLDDVPELRKLLTSTLGIPIAPEKFPHYEGTGSLFYRFSGDNKRVALLTCSHVAHPPPMYPNVTVTITKPSQRHEEIISPGSGAFDNAIKALKADIGGQLRSIQAWDAVLVRLGEPTEGENTAITTRRNQHLALVEDAKKRIGQVNDLLKEVQDRVDTSKRVIGFVLHSEKIEISSGKQGFTKDWALIELYNEMFDWDTFQGNKVYVGMSFFFFFFEKISDHCVLQLQRPPSPNMVKSCGPSQPIQRIINTLLMASFKHLILSRTKFGTLNTWMYTIRNVFLLSKMACLQEPHSVVSMALSHLFATISLLVSQGHLWKLLCSSTARTMPGSPKLETQDPLSLTGLVGSLEYLLEVVVLLTALIYHTSPHTMTSMGS